MCKVGLLILSVILALMLSPILVPLGICTFLGAILLCLLALLGFPLMFLILGALSVFWDLFIERRT